MTTTTTTEPTICADCGKDYSPDMPEPGKGGAAGYAVRYSDDARICYDCAARDELRDMHQTGRATLYLSGDETVPYEIGRHIMPSVHQMRNIRVGNWTSRLVFPVTACWTGNHNFTGYRVDVRFRDDQGAEWHGTLYGRDTQIIHCRRLKARQ